MSVVTVLLAAAALQWQTDTTISVPANARLHLTNHEGRIVVTTWERNALRVQAEHGRGDRIRIERRDGVVSVDARGRRGPASVEYRLTVPVSMALTLGAVEADIEIAGVEAEIEVETVEGTVRVRGGRGTVRLSSVDGDIVLDGARGTVRINGVDGDIRVADVIGDVTVETIDGNISLDRIEARRVDVSTVDGDLSYDGTIMDGGRYRFTSHDGDVTLFVPAGMNATVTVATFDGEFESDVPIQIDRTRSGRRFTFVLGTGAATIELETFDGAVRLRRQ